MVAAISGGAGELSRRSRPHPRPSKPRHPPQRLLSRSQATCRRSLASELNERMLAIWFMDDGYTRIRPADASLLPRSRLTRFRRVAIFRSSSERSAAAWPAGQGVTWTPPLRRRQRLDLLSETIAPFVPPSMRYKLNPDVDSNVSRSTLIALRRRFHREVLVRRGRVARMSTNQRADAIRRSSVSTSRSNHNFVTSGGVVHNCRPPGNRDPQPDEIEACEPHLFRQIELIKPTLVATLGNFATKLLSGQAGRDHARARRPAGGTLGGNAVTLYPLYHPAAALYTRAMLTVLEQDFARIPELLGRTSVAPDAGVSSPSSSPSPSGSSSRPSSSASSSLRDVELRSSSSGGNGGARRPARARARPGRRRDRLRRARLREDDVRPRRLPGARRDRAGDEPDVHDRPPLRGRRRTSRTSTSTGSRTSRRPSGPTSSRTSRTRSCSSSGPRPRATGCRRSRRSSGSSTWTCRRAHSPRRLGHRVARTDRTC